MKELKEKLFEAMRNDIYVMAEYADNEDALRAELEDSEKEILMEYAEVYMI